MSDYNHQNCRRCTGYAHRPVNDCRQQPPVEQCHTHKDDVLFGLPLAIGYVPWQIWQDIYEPEKALDRGTIFQQLDKPFLGSRGGMR